MRFLVPFLIILLSPIIHANDHRVMDRCLFFMADPKFEWDPRIESQATSQELIQNFLQIRKQLNNARRASGTKNATEFLIPEELLPDAETTIVRMTAQFRKSKVDRQNRTLVSGLSRAYKQRKSYQNFIMLFGALSEATNRSVLFEGKPLNVVKAAQVGKLVYWPVLEPQTMQSLLASMAAQLYIVEVKEEDTAWMTAHDYYHISSIIPFFTPKQASWLGGILRALDSMSARLRRNVFLQLFDFHEGDFGNARYFYSKFKVNLTPPQAFDIQSDSVTVFSELSSKDENMFQDFVESRQWLGNYLKSNPFPWP